MVRAADRSGRNPADVRLVAVTKYASLEAVRALVELGVDALGESRPQQFAQRVAELDAPVNWHFIGTLQRNKVRLVLPHAALIHSVDSLRLLERVNQVAIELGLAPRLLLEVNISGEKSKHGFTPTALEHDWDQLVRSHPGQIVGLMTMAPASDDPEQTRPCFRGLRDLRDRLARRSRQIELSELSMGMSGDFEVAIEEGATLIRVGSALFEEWSPT